MGRLIELEKFPEVSGFVDVYSLPLDAFIEMEIRVQDRLEVEYQGNIDTLEALDSLSKFLKKGDVFWMDDSSSVRVIAISMDEYLDGMSKIIDEVVKEFGLLPVKPKRRKK